MSNPINNMPLRLQLDMATSLTHVSLLSHTSEYTSISFREPRFVLAVVQVAVKLMRGVESGVDDVDGWMLIFLSAFPYMHHIAFPYCESICFFATFVDLLSQPGNVLLKASSEDRRGFTAKVRHSRIHIT